MDTQQLQLQLKHFKGSHDEANAAAVKWCELLGITTEDWCRWEDFTPLIEKVVKERDAARSACRLALNAFERNDAIDWAEVEKHATPTA